MRWILFLLFLTWLLLGSLVSCVRAPVVGDQSQRTDSSSRLVEAQPTYIPASTVQVNVNIDSLLRALKAGGKPIILKQQDNRADLQLYIDALGNLVASCTAKDSTIITLKETVNRLVRENHELTRQPAPPWYQTAWRWLAGNLLWVALVLVSGLWAYEKFIKPRFPIKLPF